MEPVPKTLDWIKARAECSGRHLFMVLATVIESDTKRANARNTTHRTEFRHTSGTDDVMMVARDHNVPTSLEGEAVVFQLDRDGSIVVTKRSARTTESRMFVARPCVALNGECKFEVHGQQLEPWQVSKLALEDLFFKFGLASDERMM